MDVINPLLARSLALSLRPLQPLPATFLSSSSLLCVCDERGRVLYNGGRVVTSDPVREDGRGR